MNTPNQPNSASPQVPEWMKVAACEIADSANEDGWTSNPCGITQKEAQEIIHKHSPQPAKAGERVRLRATIEDVIRVESNYSEDIDSSLVASLTERIINLMADATAGLAERVKSLEEQREALMNTGCQITAERDAAHAKVRELEREVVELTEKCGNKTAYIAKMETEIASLEAEVARLNRFSTTQKNLVDKNAQLLRDLAVQQRVLTELKGLKSEEIVAGLAGEKRRIAELESVVDKLRAQLAAAQAEVAQLKSDMTVHISPSVSGEKKVQELEAAVENYASNLNFSHQRIAELERDKAALEHLLSRDADLRARLAAPRSPVETEELVENKPEIHWFFLDGKEHRFKFPPIGEDAHAALPLDIRHVGYSIHRRENGLLGHPIERIERIEDGANLVHIPPCN